MWTPVRAELFNPKLWSERKGIICPVRLKNYPMRQKAVSVLEKLGVKIIERDDATRSYQDYVDDLCSARAVVNFCQDRKTGKPQVKGRVFEALTVGALLLEELNPYIYTYCPRVAFVVGPILKTCERLSQRPYRARRGRQYADGGLEASKHFSAQRFWAAIEKLAA